MPIRGGFNAAPYNSTPYNGVLVYSTPPLPFPLTNTSWQPLSDANATDWNPAADSGNAVWLYTDPPKTHWDED